MEAVGYEMYSKLLDQAVKEIEGVSQPEEAEVAIDLNVSAYIPKEYIPNAAQKIEVYQDIAIAKDESTLLDILDEIIDRFGDVPQEVNNLLEVAKIKLFAKKANIIEVKSKGENAILVFDESKFNVNIVNELINKYPKDIMFSPTQKPYITYIIEKNINQEKLLTQIQELIKFIISIK